MIISHARRARRTFLEWLVLSISIAIQRRLSQAESGSLKSKADFVKALADSFAFCDDVFSGTNEENALVPPSTAKQQQRTTPK